MLLFVIYWLKVWLFYMKNEIWASIVWAALAIAPLSGLKANNFFGNNNIRWLWNKVNTELYHSLDKDNLNTLSLQQSKEHEVLVPIDSKIVIDAALSYFDEEVKLYSLKWEARENVVLILQNYLASYPILKKNFEHNAKQIEQLDASVVFAVKQQNRIYGEIFNKQKEEAQRKR